MSIYDGYDYDDHDEDTELEDVAFISSVFAKIHRVGLSTNYGGEDAYTAMWNGLGMPTQIEALNPEVNYVGSAVDVLDAIIINSENRVKSLRRSPKDQPLVRASFREYARRFSDG